MAMVALGQFCQPEDRSWLLEIAQDKKRQNRSDALQALAEFKNEADLSLLRRLTRDRE